MTATFRSIAQVLATYLTDSMDLLNATDAVATHVGLSDPSLPAQRTEYAHDVLVWVALGNDKVRHSLEDNTGKIPPIKELRTATNCTLKAAKDAIEDERVIRHLGSALVPVGNPWDQYESPRDDEPPF